MWRGFTPPGSQGPGARRAYMERPGLVGFVSLGILRPRSGCGPMGPKPGNSFGVRPP